MRIIIASERPPALVAALLELWEASVKATHYFLAAEDIQSIKPDVKTALEAIPLLAYAADAKGGPLGFMGVAGDKIEMLFIDPAHRGQGLGRCFIRYACDELGALYVDVNEQNTQAVAFYERMGFQAFKRSEHDGQGNPFPLLHLKTGAPQKLPPGYSIRLAEARQVPLLPAIELAAAALFPPATIPETMLSEHVPLPVFHDAQREGMLWVACGAEGTPVGYALLRIIEGRALLAQMDVHPEHGRKGIGTALLRRVAARVREENMDALYLTTFAHIPWNAPFYRKAGFKALDDKETPAFLRDILREEYARGLTERIAMRMPCGPHQGISPCPAPRS